MQFQRITLILAQTSEPNPAAGVVPRTGGWSESYYSTNLNLSIAALTDVARQRARLLTSAAQVTGFRRTTLDLTNGVVTRQGASAGAFQGARGAWTTTEIPQMALQVTIPGGGVTNVVRNRLRGIPDQFVTGGEFNPTVEPNFLTYLNTWLDGYTGAGVVGLGLDLTKQRFPVVSVGNGILTVGATAGLIGVANRVHFRGCRDENTGKFLNGIFEILASTPTTLTLKGLDPTFSCGAVGSVSQAFYVTFPLQRGTYGRITVQPVGRPSVGYRGRRGGGGFKNRK